MDGGVSMGDELIQVIGAGPAGLAAAITLARSGRQVVVHEARPGVGYRFGADLQGLENWSTKNDVLDVLNDLGLTTEFENLPCARGTGYDAWGESYDLIGSKPIFYLLERGPGPHSLDAALLSQARALGVDVRFNSRVDQVNGPAVLATGPKAADGIAVGYHFETDHDNGFWVIYDNDLAPKGYAYLLVMNGRGTVKSCMFTGFKQERDYVERTVEAFQRLVGVKFGPLRPHGGVGNFRIPETAVSGGNPVVGEQAGFQDMLWGFGMRYALVSGVLAARSLLNREDYDRLWRQELGAQLWSGQVNRALFASLGNRGYRWLLRRIHTHAWDAHRVLRAFARPWTPKRLLIPWARRQQTLTRHDASCDHVDCSCVWCRHGGHAEPGLLRNQPTSIGGDDD